MERNNPANDEDFPRVLRLLDDNIYFLERQGQGYLES